MQWAQRLWAVLRKALPPLTSLSHRGSWWPVIREPWTGAWQRNRETTRETLLAHSAIYACVTLVGSDVSKTRCRIVEEDDNGIWEETSKTKLTPWAGLLRQPNHYQNRIKFFQWWMTSKLINGNTYALKVRDNRGVVQRLYILDPGKVTPLVAPDGAVYYTLSADNLSGLTMDQIAPASEIIHDVMVPLYHPLCGVSPITACALAALQGLKIQQNSTDFFANGSKPGGVLTAPLHIDPDVAKRVKDYWDTSFSGENAGKVAVLGDGLTYEPMAVNSRDSQLIEQLNWTALDIARCFHVPAHMIDAAPPPNYNNIEALNQQYYSQCLQILIEELEEVLDKGLELPKPYGTEFDLDDLLRMDTATLISSEKDGIIAGIKSPNESRHRLGLKPVTGGESPMMQQQVFSLAALAKRDRDDPFSKPAPAPTAAPAVTVGGEKHLDEDDLIRESEVLLRKAMAA